MITQGVECPECGGLKTKVQQSNLDVEGNRVRARKCEDCGNLFGTCEVPLPGLSFPRTVRSDRPNGRVVVPQHVRVTVTGSGVTLRVVPVVYGDVCRRGHPFTPENTYTPPGGKRTCRQCRLTNARERYHDARRKAPESILADQRRKWREAWRRRAA